MRHVLVAADVNPGMKEQWHTADGGPDVPETPRPPLAEDEVRFVGDCVAVVVAEDRSSAEDAADLVDVEYETLPALVDDTEAEQSDVLVHQSHGSNVCGEINGLPAVLGARGRVRFGRTRHVGNHLPAGVHRRPDGDPRPRRRLPTL